MAGQGLVYSYQAFPDHAIAPASGFPLPTTWPNGESPARLGGVLVQGDDAASVWHSINSDAGSPGIAYASAFSTGSFDDSIFTVPGQFNAAKHFTEMDVFIFPAYAPGGTHEIEGLVGMTILIPGDTTSRAPRGYEIDMGYLANAQPVRWNGDGTFDTGVFTNVSGATFAVAGGDRFFVGYDSITTGSPVITMKVNGATMWVITDTSAGKIMSGSPGFGAFVRNDAAQEIKKYCINRYNAGNL